MADRRPAPRRTTFALREFATPLWRRAGFWQAALASLALVPLLGALVVRLTPIAPVAPGAAVAEAPPAPALPSIARDPAPAESLQSIAALNLFAPTRTDWALVVAEADAAPEDDASLKAAEEALEKMVFVAVIRVRDEWGAMFDLSTRKPEEDLLRLGVGDEHEGWQVREITRSTITLDFRGEVRTLDLRPRTPLKPARAAADAPKRGRADVSVRPAETKRGMFYEEPPISLEETTRQLRDLLKDDEQSIRDRLDELLRRFEDDA